MTLATACVAGRAHSHKQAESSQSHRGHRGTLQKREGRRLRVDDYPHQRCLKMSTTRRTLFGASPSHGRRAPHDHISGAVSSTNVISTTSPTGTFSGEEGC